MPLRAELDHQDPLLATYRPQEGRQVVHHGRLLLRRIPVPCRYPICLEALHQTQAKWLDGVIVIKMAHGAVVTLAARRVQPLVEVATFESITNDTRNHSSVATMVAHRPSKEAFRARKIAQGMKQSTIRASRVNGRDATGCSRG